ncbi:hypothetical protein NAL32_16300 [Chryseobacterium sp. Ch-15]|uniref:Uncharacterized protein n=1 Tax=Chryseobacterium muglaense TaxID=2893752 RepID=A0A9Q3YSH8_9FLAO|nr:hypothetical protein [Chryseobacterium muglaense]MBD3906213.1 hypothetical protein [Chryseobacterium muglaense]MCC9033832.1 hypothetical protein [Chryseobacterium muglaense]MCM2555948.1 hypothetical protein [Chryseobacterium muglaense]
MLKPIIRVDKDEHLNQQQIEKIKKFYNNRKTILKSFNLNGAPIKKSQTYLFDGTVFFYLIEEDVFKKNEIVKKLIEKKKKCAIKEIDVFMPLESEETLVYDKLVFLKANYKTYKKGDVFLIRKTNLSEVFYFFGNENLMQNYDVHSYNIPGFKEESCLISSESSVSNKNNNPLGNITKKIVSNLLDKLTGGLVDIFIDAIFPTTLPDLLDETYRKIAQLVGDKINELNLNEIKFKCETLMSYLKYDYSVRKEKLINIVDSEKKQNLKRELYDELKVRHRIIREELLPTLKAQNVDDKDIFKFAPALYTIILLMSLQAHIEQELIFTDPNVIEESQSAYIEVSRNLLRENIDYINIIYDKLLNFRKEQVIKLEEQDHEFCDPDYPWNCYYDTYATFQDKFSDYHGRRHQTNPEGKNGEKRKSAEELRDQEYTEYINKIADSKNFISEISFPKDTLIKLEEYKNKLNSLIKKKL